jgi:hypothetical protein
MPDSPRPQTVRIEPAIEHDIALPIRPMKSVRIEPAIEHDLALPIRALKAAVTPPPQDATPAERRKWIEEEALIVGYAGTAGGLGGLLGGPAWGVACAFLGGMYAAIKVTRRSG